MKKDTLPVKKIKLDMSRDPNRNIYRHIAMAARETDSQVYFVGGWIRNLLLNRPILDIDLLVYGTGAFLSSLRRKAPSTLICLDKERKIYRLALRKSSMIIDLTFEKDHVSLFQNLNERDFTINAMAIKCDNLEHPDRSIMDLLTDPFNGKQDAKKGVIRMVRKENFLHDPLRLCRAFRFGAEYGFTITDETLQAISEHAFLIHQVSPERVHEEWIKMMQTLHAAPYIQKMKEFGLLDQIFPEISAMERLDQGPKHKLTLWEHSWNTLLYLESMLNNPDRYLKHELRELVPDIKAHDSDSMACLKTAALFHDIGKPKVKGIGKKGQVTFYGHQKTGGMILKTRMETLRFSKAEIRLTTKWVEDHMRPLMLSLAKKVSDRAKARFFIHLGQTWQGLLLLSVADILATQPDQENTDDYLEFVNALVLFRKGMEKRVKETPLISGDDLKKELLFPPGPLMGKVLRMINESYLSGVIKTKKEALGMAKKFLRRPVQ